MTPAAEAGGLFGAGAAPEAGGSLFGAPAAEAGGLFGAGAALEAGGSLFGAPAAEAGGLFGAAPEAGGSLFGADSDSNSDSDGDSSDDDREIENDSEPRGVAGAAPGPGGSLFGAPAAPAGGLFGAGAAPEAGGGLFGAPAAEAGGLFGAGAAPEAGGSLFGAPAAEADGARANLIPLLVQAVQNGDFRTRKEAAWAISNLTSGGSKQHIEYLVQQGVIKPLSDLLEVSDAQLIKLVLDASGNLLKAGVQPDGSNPVADYFEECGGMEKIEECQSHENEKIYEKALELIETYFGEEDEEEDDMT
eukprot:gene4527-26539_t